MLVIQMTARTLFEKVWDRHVVCAGPAASSLLYIDLHLVDEVTSPQAFAGLREAGHKVRRPDLTFAIVDHSMTTRGTALDIPDHLPRTQVESLHQHCREFRIP